MADLVAMDEITKAIQNQTPVGDLRKMHSLTKIQKEWLRKRLKKADFSEKMRLHYYLGVLLDDENEVQECFRTIQSEVLESTIKHLSYNKNAKIVTDHHTVKLPLRVNWGGGWRDTPPYCNENGGTVLNVAILLKGEKPVEVTLEKIGELKIVFDSRDMDVHGEFDMIEPLQATGDPFDPFALQKACLLACGIIPKEGHELSEILKRLGGGFVMHSEVTNVPKGSGLGTSSILSAACVKAVFEFMGIEYTEDGPIVYSLGDFWFNDETKYTGLLNLEITSEGLKQMSFTPCEQKDSQTQYLNNAESQRALFDHLQEISPNITIDDTGVITELKDVDAES